MSLFSWFKGFFTKNTATVSEHTISGPCKAEDKSRCSDIIEVKNTLKTAAWILGGILSGIFLVLLNWLPKLYDSIDTRINKLETRMEANQKETNEHFKELRTDQKANQKENIELFKEILRKKYN